MPIISIKDNENSRWKRNSKKNPTKNTNKDRKEQGGTKAIVKVWELNDFVCIYVRFSPVNM